MLQVRKIISIFVVSCLKYMEIQKEQTFADKVIDFNRNLNYVGTLPEGFQVLNPYLDNPETMEVMQKFYHKYYNDTDKRKFIIGINPSRNRSEERCVGY